MRQSNEQSISEVITKLLEAYHLKDGVNVVRIRDSWEELMGNAIFQRTASVDFKKNRLIIRLKSAVLRQELEYKKEEIIKALNEKLNENIITEIQFQ